MGEVEIHAVDGVDFEINEGEFVVIVGPSGAGKTTVLNILGGMDKATSGHVIVDGVDISSFNSRQLTSYRRDDIGFVFQFYNLPIRLPLYIVYFDCFLIYSIIPSFSGLYINKK